MIQIPIELGDVIRVGRFKNKKITVKEIGIDENNHPTVNGRGILKVRIEKLMPPKEPKTENNMNKPNKIKLDKMITSMLKESFHPNDTQVKIKQKDKLWWICQTETDECLNAVGFDSKEAAEHSALTKGYNFSGQENMNEMEPEVLTTKKEKVKGVDKVEDMKLDKEKEIKLEILRIAKRVIKEEVDRVKFDPFFKKTFHYPSWIENNDRMTPELLKKAFFESYPEYKNRKPEDVRILANDWLDFLEMRRIVKKNIINKTNLVERFQSKKKIKINELEVTDPSIVKKLEEMAKMSDEMDRLKNEMTKLKKLYEPLDEEITAILEEVAKTGDRALETKTILVTIKKMGNPAVEVAAYKERFEQLYSKVNGAMKAQSDKYWESVRTFKKIPTSIGVQYKKTEGRINEESVISRLVNKVKSFFSSIYNKIIQYGKVSDQGIAELHKLTGV